MQLKRRLVGLRVPARGPGGSRKPSGSAGLVGGSRVGPALPRGAGQRRLPSARRASGEVALRLRGDRTARRAAVRGRPRRALRSFARCGAGRLLVGCGPSSGGLPLGCTACSARRRPKSFRSWRRDNSCRGRWRPNGCIRPVLKHGPRSATCARVFGWQTPRRSESVSGTRPAVARASGLRAGGASSTDPVPRRGGI